mmetsp:Transcript_33940/g.81411  ORF Transcript_33940/g.81411 Transcript_33940/m.81411 type:complete len:210 (-) Transcript_33940:143-772(-)
MLHRIRAEAEDVASAGGSGLDNQGLPKLGVPHVDALHLQVRNGDIEVLGQHGKPHSAHVGDDEGPQVALVGGEVPNAVDLLVHLLVREHDELLLADDGAPKFQISIELGGLIAFEDRLDCGEQPRAVLHQRCEDELEAGGVVARHDIERLAVPTKLRVHRADIHARDAVEANTQIRPCILGRGPNEPKVGDNEDPPLAIVALGVLHRVN